MIMHKHKLLRCTSCSGTLACIAKTLKQIYLSMAGKGLMYSIYIQGDFSTMASFKSYFQWILKILSASWWPPSLLRSTWPPPCTHTCPKVIISRLIAVVDWGARSQSRSRNAGNSVEPKFGFSNLNYSVLLADERPNEVPFNRP